MSKINLDRVRNVFKESEKADENIYRSTSDQALLRARRMASDQAKAAFVSDESVYNNEATIDPYDTTTKASKASKKDLLSLSGNNYRTSLLEQLVKNQNNKEFNTSVLTFQDKTLTYLDSIESILKNQFAPDDKNKDSFYNQNKQLGREISDLAKAMTEMNPGNMAKAMKKGFLSQFGLDQVAGMADLAFSSIKDAIKSGDIGTMIKQTIQDQIVNSLPKNTRDKVKRFKDDPANFFQDVINTLAIDRNSAIAKIFKPHARGFKPSDNTEKFDASALAKFDNKFYTSVTKIMPDQLFKMNVFLEKLATGKVSNIQTFDWEKGDYTTLIKDIKEFLNNASTNQKATDSLYKDLTDQIQTIIEKGSDRSGLLSRKTKRDSNGFFEYDDDGTTAFTDKEEFKQLLSEIVNSKGGFNELRSSSANLDDYLQTHNLGYKTVGGKTYKKSDKELANMRNNLVTLQTILLSMDPEMATKLEESLMNFKTGISQQKRMETHGWDPSIFNQFVDVANSSVSPDVLRDIFGPSGVFGAGSSGTSSSQSTSNRPSKYKNSKGQMVDWSQLTESERVSFTNAYIKDNKIGSRLSEDIIFKRRSKLQTGETEETKRVRKAYESGVLTKAEYTDYLGGARPYDSLKSKLDNYDEAIKIFNDLDSMGLTASQMRANNQSMSISDYERLGYMSSPEQLYRYMKNGKLDIDRLTSMNSMYSQSFADNLSRIAKRKQEGPEFDSYDKATSINNIISSVFGDPRIAKKAGIAAGTAAGLGINKILKTAGIIDSPKLGIVLGGVGAALMMTERAQNAVKNIFGPDGDVKNANGYTNKEIFMSKLMTRWLPSIGAGAKVASATAKFFSHGGPVMAAMGIPAALITGLTASWIAPKMVSWAQKKLFSKEAREKGGFLGKAGEWIKSLNIPFVNKYIIGDKGEQTEVEIQISALTREQGRIGRELADVDDKIKKDPNSKDLGALQDRFKLLKKEYELYDKAIGKLRSIQNSQDSEEKKKTNTLLVISDLEDSLNNLDKSGSSTSSLKVSTEQARSNAEFSAGEAANSKFGGTKERAAGAYNRFISEGGDPNSDEAKRLAAIEKSGSFDQGFSDYSTAYSRASIDQYELYNRMKMTNDFSNYSIDEELIKNMRGKTKDEKIAILDQWVNDHSGSESAPLIRDYIKSKLQQDDSRTQLFKAVYAVQKIIHPEMEEYDLQLLVNSEVASILSRGKVKAGTQYAREKGVDILKDEIYSRSHDFFRESYNGDRVGSDQSRSSLNNLYSEISNTDVPNAGTGTEGDNKIFKMSELSDYKFKNGSSLSEAGCSIVAFNNALYYLGIPQVEVNTLVSVANKYLTSNGGVTSEFFLEMCQRLNITAKIYNSTDNRFTVDSLRQLAPDKSRSLIVLLRNTNNDGAHFITIKSVGSKTCVVNDPEVNGTVDMSISTIISRAIEFILISKTAAVENRLTETEESKSFGAKFKEWFKKTKAGKAVEMFKSAVSGIKSGINKVKDIIQNPTSIKDIIGGFFSRGKESDNKPDVTQETNSLLQQILDKLNGIYEKPIPVSIWTDQTLALQSTDDRASQVLADAALTNSDNAKEATNAKKIKTLRRKREIQKERSEAQAVQDAIINGETSLAAGRSSRVGGRGTGMPGSGAEPNNTQVTDQSKGGIWGTIGSFFRKPIAKVVGKYAPWLAGAAAATAPAYLAYKLSKPYAQMSVNQTKALFQAPTENVVDENGVVTEGGQYRDPSGLARNVWNIKSLAKGTFALTKKMATGFGGMATKIASTTSKVTGKIGRWGARGGKIAQKVGKYGGKVAKYVGGAAEAFAKGGKAAAELLTNGLFEKLGKLVDGLTSLAKWPIVGKVAKYLGDKIGPIIMWLKGKGAKIIQRLTKKALSPQNMKSKIPFIGLGLSVMQAAASIIVGWKDADKVLRLPEEVIDTRYRFISAAAKFFWDALPMLASSVIGQLTGGVGGVAADACIAIFQMVYGFDNYLSDSWHIDDKLRVEVGGKLYKDYDKKEEEGEKQLDETLKEAESEDKEKNNQAEKDAKAIQDGINSKIDNEVKNSNNKVPEIDVTLEADAAAQASHHKEYMFGENSIAGMIERYRDKGAREQRKQKKEYGEEYEKKRREQIMNSPSVKAAMEAWKANPGKFFHPMGKPDTRITSVFGPRNVQGGSKNHRGVDFSSGGQSGKPIYAYKAGKVITSSPNYGLIEIQHADGTVSRYMHLSDRFPKVGQEVAMGEVIGTSGGIGKNGASKYVPHLHFEVRDSAGRNLDPFLQMSLDPKVINVSPAWKNQENIAYFERYPWLKEKAAQADLKIKQAEKADSSTSNANRVPTLSDKPVGGPSDNDPMYDRSHKSELERSKSTKPSSSSTDKMLVAMNANSKDDLIVQLLQQQVQLMKQNSQLMQTLVNIVGEIKSSGENSNNDMLGALSMSRY